ncbi:MAG: Rieske 2Fe-2S domain-containing protein [Burkholderiales bacterium]|nr:Rieske 2Fe-2S domain-containing protein [Burkholderiales bacterium]
MPDLPAGLPITVTEGPPAEERLCDAAELVERGRAFVWDVMLWGRPARAFALRFDGRPVAYLNRCVHVPTEMDWQEGEFLDIDKRWILCSIHGAAYEPADGRCVGGPCGRGKLTALRVAERDGQVYWYPSRDIAPVRFDEAAAPAPAPDAERAVHAVHAVHDGDAPPTSPTLPTEPPTT